MDGEAHVDSYWIEEINGNVQAPARKKRRYVKRKKEYLGWGSTSLIRFLESLGINTSNKISQNEVTKLVNEYVKQSNLFHPTKKKRIQCDERLHSLFGRKTISRLKINDLLESHFADNCGESSDDLLFDSEDDENAACETPKPTPVERKIQPRKAVIEKPKSCFAAIIPFNVKLVYLKRSLVQDLLKDPETFETKVVGSFIRVKCDPNDYLQKNSHQLLQITGIKKSSGVDGEIRLQASGFIKDISINMLSDDNFSEEECKDLHQRVKDDLLKRPTVVDMEQKARVLHEDMIKHWIPRELTLLQHLIDRSNERGLRRELAEYLQKREKLQSPDEQERLLREFPRVIAEDLESESVTPDVPDEKVENDEQEFWQATYTREPLVTEVPKAIANGSVGKAMKLNVAADLVRQESNSPKSILSSSGASDVPHFNLAMNSISSDTAGEHQWSGMPVRQQPEQQTDIANQNNGMSQPAELNKAKNSQGLLDKQVQPPPVQIIDLSNGVSQPAISNEAKISLGPRDKQVQPSPPQVQIIDLSNGVSQPAISNEAKISQGPWGKQVQPSPVPFQIIGLSNGMSLPAISNEAKISQGPWDKQGQPSPAPFQIIGLRNGMSQPSKSNEAKISQGPRDKAVRPSPPQDIIEVSDDDDEEQGNPEPRITYQVSAEQLNSLMWYYKDPQGNIQGPFSAISLKRWSDACYFPPDFKVWRTGQSQKEAVLLVVILAQFFPR